MTIDIDFAFELGRAKTLVGQLRKAVDRNDIREAHHLTDQTEHQIEILRNAIILLLKENRVLLNEVRGDYE